MEPAKTSTGLMGPGRVRRHPQRRNRFAPWRASPAAKPKAVGSDNRTELTSNAILASTADSGVV